MIVLGGIGAFLGRGVGDPLKPAVDPPLPVHLLYADERGDRPPVAQAGGLLFIDQYAGVVKDIIVGDMVEMIVCIEHHIDAVFLFQFSQALGPRPGIDQHLHVIVDKNRTAVGISAAVFSLYNLYRTELRCNVFSPLQYPFCYAPSAYL